ncbi:MAG TPA: ATP-binding cassette domain-containing protein [Acidimicrobiales bacterium]|nr:ATP-binding cassette domain-containing protein [Acidimicrobiales bacterium]
MDLVVQNLTIEYQSGDYTLRPVDNLSFRVPSGSLALLLGPSGCGKSTLLSCLAGILTPTSGMVAVGGEPVTGLTGNALTDYRRRTVGIVFQAFNLVPSLTAAENVMAPLRAAGVGRGEANARAAELLAEVSLTDRADHLPAQLSGGQQQRVAIARALAHEPPIVLADEPTAHLDYVQVEAVLRLIRSLARPGRSVIVATHDERMLPLADVVIEMLPKFVEGADKPEKLTLAAGEVLFEQGSLGGKIYVVDTGEVEIERDGKVVYVNKPGQHFGEMGPLFNLPRSATARAGAKGARLTGYTLRQYGDIVGLDTLGDVLGKAGRVSAPVKKAGTRKAPATKKAPAKRTVPVKKTVAKKNGTAKKAAAPRR